MFRTYKYRIYPTEEQEALMNDLLWAACWLYNRALEHRRKRWYESRHSVTFQEQANLWKQWRNEDPEENQLQILGAHAGQRVLRKLNQVYSEFMKGNRGYPRFKSVKRYNSIMLTNHHGASLKDKKLHLQNIGEIPIRWSRDLPPNNTLKSFILVRKPSGWYILLQIELPEPCPEPSMLPTVIITLTADGALSLSDGITFKIPMYLEQSLQELRILHRTIVRRKWNSNRWKKAVHQYAKLHEHISNQRRDWWHKTTEYLVNHYGTIILKGVSVESLLADPAHSNRLIYDRGQGIFLELLTYKAMEAGCQVQGLINITTKRAGGQPTDDNVSECCA